MEWPSKNVPRGGFMHAAKSSYSPDTHKFLKFTFKLRHASQRFNGTTLLSFTVANFSLALGIFSSVLYLMGKDWAVFVPTELLALLAACAEPSCLSVLMEESKLSMLQRKKFNYCLRNGEPLPPISHTSRSRVNIPEVTIRPGSSKRRTRESIVQSGAYEREEFRPHHPVVDREKEKERLQNKMAYNEEIKVRKPKIFQKLVSKEDKEEINRFDQIVQEIKEREEWLKEMEALGQGNKYRQIIELQIQEKVREMNKMKFENIKQ